MKNSKVKNISLDELGGMVSQGFSDMDNKMDNRFRGIEGSLEQVKLRLDNTAHRFELVALEKRVTHLEKKAGVR